MVIYRLELRPGSIVVESGTGSGSLTSSLARTVSPSGHVFTFEFHAQRAEAAREDFQLTGLSSAVTVTNRDACKEGFLLEEKGLLPATADGVFLDLPSPWEAIPHAEKVLKSGGMLCSFSPCIEQVQKAVAAMGTQFIDTTTIECLLRPYDVRNYDVEHYNLDLGDTTQNSKRQKIESISTTTTTTTTSTTSDDKEKGKQKEENADNNENEDKDEDEDTKKTTNENTQNTNNSFHHQSTTSVASEYKRGRKSVVKTMLLKPITDIRGHTGYLTFARKV